jgi:uncharacterized membrane protein SpoIIM required for sporulation
VNAAHQPKSLQFRREREATWKELEELCRRIEAKGLKALDAGELVRLPTLYRATVSSLSVARAISLDKNLVDYLEALAARAYFSVYATRRGVWEALGGFFGSRFPEAVRRFKWQVLASALAMALGAVTGYAVTDRSPELYDAFVAPELAQGRDPTAPTAELRQALYDPEVTVADHLTAFSSFLFTHNANVGILCFVLGFLAGVPTLLLLFQNGLMLGAFGALYHSRGLGVDLWGWLLPHGVTELLAVVLCGAAGLAIGQALCFPGRYRRLDKLTLVGREVGLIVVGSVALFFVAGLIEGFFRQLVQDIVIRYAVVVLTAGLWIGYFGFVRGPGGNRGTGAQP